jgi:hypothetical protein
LWAVFAFLTAAGASAATTGDIGAGVLAGHPMGPTVELWLGPSRAVNIGVGFNDLSLYADYQWHNWTLLPQPAAGRGRLGSYAALGGQIERQEHDEARAGVRTLVGATYWFPRERIELYAEIGPVFVVSPDADVDIDGGAGIRFYFRR